MFIALFRTLCWLSLYNCKTVFLSLDPIDTIEKLTQLKHLDLSEDESDEPVRIGSPWQFPLVNEDTLEQLLASLPNLTSLDLSGELARKSVNIIFLKL